MLPNPFLKSQLRLLQSFSARNCPQLLQQTPYQQQQQQMSNTYDDNGPILFFELKHLFFDEHLKESEIIDLIRDSPLKTIYRILSKLTDFYSRQVDAIAYNLEEEKQSLTNRLAQVKERLGHSLDDNEYFKSRIDRLEEEKKYIEVRLNQSESDIQRSIHDCEIMQEQKAEIVSENSKLFEYNQNLHAQSSYFQKICQKQGLQLQHLKQNSQKMMQENDRLSAECLSLKKQIFRLRQDNQILEQKLHSKEMFIAEINKYNRYHFFQHHDQLYAIERKAGDYPTSFIHELQASSFNEESQDLVNKSLNGSEHEIESQEAEPNFKLVNLSATIQKFRPFQMKQLQQSEQKPECQPSSGFNSKRNSPFRQKNPMKTSEIIRGDRMVWKQQQFQVFNKTISSKNLVHVYSHVESDIDQPKILLQEILRAKLSEKIQQNCKLTRKLNRAEQLYIRQRQKITEMEGEYEIKIDDKKNQIQSLKTELTKLYQKYVLISSQNQIQQEKIKQQQEKIILMQNQYLHYSTQLKNKCKAYILDRISQVQQHHQNIIRQLTIRENLIQQNRQQGQQEREDGQERLNEEQSGSIKQVEQKSELEKSEVRSISVQEVSPWKGKVESSDSFSYKQIQGHQMDSLQLNLQFSTNNNRLSQGEQGGEVFIKDTFEIQSDLGRFTERLHGLASSRIKGNYTSRSPKIIKSQIDLYRPVKPLNLKSSIVSINLLPSHRHLSMANLKDIAIQPGKKRQQNDFLNRLQPKIMKQLDIFSQACKIKLQVHKKQCILESSIVQYHIESKAERHLKVENQISINLLSCKEKKQSLISNLGVFSKNEGTPSVQSCSSHKQRGNTKETFDTHNNSCLNSNLQIKSIDLEHVNGQNYASNCNQDHQENIALVTSFGIHEVESNEREESIQNSRNSINQSENLLKKYFVPNGTEHNSPYCSSLIKQNSHYEVQNINDQSAISSNSEIKTVEINFQPQIQNSNLSNKMEQSINALSQFRDSDKKANSQMKEIVYSQENRNSDLNKTINWVQSQSQQCSKQRSILKLVSSDSKHQTKAEKSSHKKAVHINESGEYSIEQQNSSSNPVFLKEVAAKLNPSCLNLLKMFCAKHKISVQFKQMRQIDNFTLPSLSKRSLLILLTEKTFVLNEKRLFCLEDGTSLKLQKTRYINNNNFVLGQSEVLITPEKQFVISREGKFNKLQGNMVDGKWNISGYISCQYHVRS